MANIELNALSVITCGSFTARVFVPEIDKLQLNDSTHEKKYPVLWLLHTDGESSIDWMRTPAERLATRYGIIIIAPDQHHALTTNMDYGPRYEEFLSRELPGICRNTLPISENPAKNWIAGVGTGAYGAIKMALKYPEVYSKAAAINGILDMERAIDDVLDDRDPGFPHTKASLEAVFGNLNTFHGSHNDIYALAQQPHRAQFLLCWEEDFPYRQENMRLVQILGAQTRTFPAGSDFNSCQQTLSATVDWLAGAYKGADKT